MGTTRNLERAKERTKKKREVVERMAAARGLTREQPARLEKKGKPASVMEHDNDGTFTYFGRDSKQKNQKMALDMKRWEKLTESTIAEMNSADRFSRDQAAQGRSAMARVSAGGIKDDAPGLDAYQNWIGQAGRALNDEASRGEIDNLLSQVDDLRSGLASSDLSDKGGKTGGAKLTMTQGSETSRVWGAMTNDRDSDSPLRYAVNTLNKLELQLKNKRRQLRADAQGAKRYGSAQAYRAAREAGPLNDADSLNRQLSQAQEINSKREEAVRELSGIESQVGVRHADLERDEALRMSSPVMMAAYEAATEIQEQINAYDEALALAGVNSKDHSQSAIDDQVFQIKRDAQMAKGAYYQTLNVSMPNYHENAAAGLALENPNYNQVNRWGGVDLSWLTGEEGDRMLTGGQDYGKVTNKYTYARDNAQAIRASRQGRARTTAQRASCRR